MRAGRRNQRTQLLHYSVAVLSVAVALGLTRLLTPWISPTITPLFLVAVMVSAWVGDWQAGLLATILSTLAGCYFFTEPFYSLQILGIKTIVRLGVFAIAAGVISWLSQSRRIALVNARTNYQMLRETVEREEAARTRGSQTEEALRQSEALLHTVAANLSQGAGFVVDRNLRYLLAEGKALTAAGMTSEDLVGKTIWEALDPALAAEYETSYRQALRGKPFQLEHYSHDRHYISHGTPLVNNQGKIYAVLAMSYDITDSKQVEAQLRRTAELDSFRVALNDALRSLTDSIQIQAEACRLLGEHLGVERAYYVEVNEAENYARVNQNYLRGDSPSLVGVYQITDYGWVMPFLQRGETVIVADMQTSDIVPETERTAMAAVRITAHISLPLVKAGALVGALCVTQSTPRQWLETEIELVRETAERIWAAAERARVEETVAADLQDTQLLRRLATQSLTEGDIQTLYQEIMATAIALTHADAGTVQILDDATQELVLLATQGFDRTMIDHFYRVNASSNTPCGIALRSGDRTLVDFDVPESEDPDGSMRMHIEAGLLSAQSTPLITRSGRAIGMVSTHWHDHHRSGDRELRFLDLLARQAADLIEQRQFEQALRRSESRFRLMVESAKDYAIYTLDLNGIVTGWNTGAERLLGYTEAEIVGRQNRLIFTPEDDERGDPDREMQRARTQGRAENERWHVRQDGSCFWGSGLMMPLQDEAGILQGFVKIMQDKTSERQHAAEREQLLQQEQTARAEADRANRVKDEFLAVLSHELRSPLNPILGWTKLLQGGNLTPVKTEQALKTIERNAQLQSELIEDLLDISRILRGKINLNVSPVNLAVVIRAAIETMRLAADAKALTVEADLAEGAQVSGDATRLQQVAWNLLSNAVKFTPTGGHVEVRLALDEPDTSPNLSGSSASESVAQITVRDSGKGISPDFLPHVFDYFQQEDSATTRRFGGLGLGLAIVRQIVELHGGTVWAESQGEGQGATFTVRLPLMRTENRKLRTKDLALRTPHSALRTPLEGSQILVVDDETDSRDFIAFVVEQAGARVSTAASGAEAIALLMQSQFDVLLSDIGMPEMDGYMLMQQVRSLPPEQNGQLKAIALTAYAGDFNQQQALQAGYQQHVSKPVEPAKLVTTIASLVGQRE